MSETLRSEILKDFDVKVDMLSWRPALRLLANEDASTPIPAELLNFGPSAVARLGMAAVEQYAQLKVLADGSTEKLRYITLRYFGEAMVESSFWFGEAETMERIADSATSLIPMLNEMHLARCIRRLRFRKMIAAGIDEVLLSIEKRKERLRTKGRPTVQLEIDMTPERRFQAVIDVWVINDCANKIHMNERNNIEAIRTNIRDVVRAYVLNGTLDERGKRLRDCIDSHAKRISGRLDKIAASRGSSYRSKLDFNSAFSKPL